LKILCLVPTLLEDSDSDCLASIQRQTVSVDHIELVTQRVQGGTFPERVSYVLNKALEKFTLENYDFLLRVDGDTVLPKDFVEKGIAAECDLYGTIGYAKLIRVQPFLRCMNGRFFRFSNDMYIPHCFVAHGFKVCRGDFSKVKTRNKLHSWMYYYVIGSNYYRLGYTILHFAVSLKPKQLRMSAMLLAGFVGSWCRKIPKFDIADAVQALQIGRLKKC
jgi:hypothetical protein